MIEPVSHSCEYPRINADELAVYDAKWPCEQALSVSFGKVVQKCDIVSCTFCLCNLINQWVYMCGQNGCTTHFVARNVKVAFEVEHKIMSSLHSKCIQLNIENFTKLEFCIFALISHLRMAHANLTDLRLSSYQARISFAENLESDHCTFVYKIATFNQRGRQGNLCLGC